MMTEHGETKGNSSRTGNGSPRREAEPPPETFTGLGLGTPLVAVLTELGYEAPTPIQRRTIPALLGGRDVIGQAQTGTGKTAAFALPILERLDRERAEVQALVLTPTRELSIQVAEAVQVYARKLERVRVLPLYGGQSIQPQLRSLSRGVTNRIATPPRPARPVRPIRCT